MHNTNGARWGAATGYFVFLLGIAGAAFERGAPPANAPVAETLAFFVQYRSELLAQSLLFVLSTGAYLCFFGYLRGYLYRAEGDPGTLATIGFGAGVAWAGIQMVMQSVQAALAMAAGAKLDPSLATFVSDLAYALSVIAYVPMAVVLATMAVVGFRTRAFPSWVSGLAALTGLINLVMSLGLIVDSGPLVPGGLLTYGLYVLMVVWLLATTTVMVIRLGPPRRHTLSLQRR